MNYVILILFIVFFYLQLTLISVVALVGKNDIKKQLFESGTKQLEPNETLELLKIIRDGNSKGALEFELNSVLNKKDVVDNLIESSRFIGLLKCPYPHMEAISIAAKSNDYKKSLSLQKFINDRYAKCKETLDSILKRDVYMLPFKSAEAMPLLIESLVATIDQTDSSIAELLNRLYSLDISKKVDKLAFGIYKFLNSWLNLNLPSEKNSSSDQTRESISSIIFLQEYNKQIVEMCDSISRQLKTEVNIYEPFTQKGMPDEKNNFARFWYVGTKICTEILDNEPKIKDQVIRLYSSERNSS